MVKFLKLNLLFTLLFSVCCLGQNNTVHVLNKLDVKGVEIIIYEDDSIELNIPKSDDNTLIRQINVYSLLYGVPEANDNGDIIGYEFNWDNSPCLVRYGLEKKTYDIIIRSIRINPDGSKQKEYNILKYNVKEKKMVI